MYHKLACQWIALCTVILSVSSPGFIVPARGQTVIEAEPPTIQRLASPATALDRYVGLPDESFAYELEESGAQDGCVWLRYHLISQTWNEIEWKHVLWILLPQATEEAASDASKWKIQGDSSILFIGGGSWKGEWAGKPPTNVALPREYALLSKLAITAQTPLAIIEQVPFQPILDGRYEDQIIAETFRRFLSGEGEDWPLLLPMVKSAVRAMDLVQQELAERFQVDVQRFTVTGASKRGWTTWLTSAVDSRVDALAPIVIDMLNMPKQMEHQYASWGKYSEEIADYTNLNLQQHLSTPAGQKLQAIVDPYAYRERITQPKLLIFGTNDRYWTVDACNLYWNELLGDKAVLYTPNQGHGIRDFDRLIGSLAYLHRSRTQGVALPEIKFDYQDTALESKNGFAGKFALHLATKPEAVQLWLAKSATRDFRDATWVSQPLQTDSSGAYAANIEHDTNNYQAFFGEVVLGTDNLPAYFSTNMTVISPE